MRRLRLPLRILDNRLGRVPKPSWCTFLVCNRCNARCGMCDAWKLDRGDEMSVDEVRAVFEKLGPLDVVRLSGGEPFLRKDFAALAEAVMAASAPRTLHVTTNGSFPGRVEAFAAGFSRPRRLRIMVSLDGLETTHDDNRGPRVSFARALETIRRVVALRPSGVRISVNHTVISRASMDEAAELRERLAELGVDVQSVLAYADSAMYGASRRGTEAEDLVVKDGYPLHDNLYGADAVGFVEGEEARLRDVGDLPVRIGKAYYLKGLKARLRGEPDPEPRPPCTALRSHIRLLPNGDVPVCQFNTRVVGNLLREPLESLWREAAREARAWVDACEGCWAECEVIPNAIYSGDIAGHALREALRPRR